MDAKTQQQYAETFRGLHKKGIYSSCSTPGTCHGQSHREGFSGGCGPVAGRSRPRLGYATTEKMYRWIW
jgi:hypothetical protein